MPIVASVERGGALMPPLFMGLIMLIMGASGTGEPIMIHVPWILGYIYIFWYGGNPRTCEVPVQFIQCSRISELMVRSI